MAPREIKWGILATGGIALTFARDLVIPPSTRGVTNLTHRIVAAASSSSKARAEDFLKEVGEAAGKAKGEDAVKGAKAYGSYEEVSAWLSIVKDCLGIVGGVSFSRFMPS